MIRTHHSRKKIKALHEVKQLPVSSDPSGKPHGLWYSVDKDWERWCKSEMPGWIIGTFIYKINLKDE